MMMRFLLLSLFILIGGFYLSAQKVDNYTYLQTKYAEEDAVILSLKRSIDIRIVEDSLLIKGFNEEERYFINDKSQGLADYYVYYSNFFQLGDLEAYYYYPNDGKYKKEKVDNIADKSYYSSSVLFEDSRYKHIIFPKVSEGCRTWVSYSYTLTEPRLLSDFLINSYMPIKDVEYSVSFPNDVKLKYTVFNDTANSLKFEKSEIKGITTYKWTGNNIPDYDLTSNTVPPRYFVPIVVVYIDEYTNSEGNHKLLTDLNELHRWYYSLTKDLNNKEEQQLNKLIDSLVVDIPDPAEQIKTIYYWVQDNIKYVAVLDGMRGFVPEKAINVYTCRYGDCKGMSSILNTMLNIAGFESYLTWVGTRNKPYKYTEIPTPIVDNHMIVSVKLDDTWYFLDATNKNLPIELPSRAIQGKQTLISKSEAEYEIVTVPVIEKEVSGSCDSIFLTIREKDLGGTGLISFKGY
ncbi:DUF3857 domain-containing protein, partial [Bacteroidota bacterium]